MLLLKLTQNKVKQEAFVMLLRSLGCQSRPLENRVTGKSSTNLGRPKVLSDPAWSAGSCHIWFLAEVSADLINVANGYTKLNFKAIKDKNMFA